MPLQIEVDEEVARLESTASPLYTLLEKIDGIARDKKESPLELDLVFQYGEGTWDSCATVWTGETKFGVPCHNLKINGGLVIDALKEDLRARGYKAEHQCGGDSPLNIIRLILNK